MTPRQILPILHYLCKVKADPPSPWVEDARLLEQYRHDGDETAFAQLVRRHGPRVLAVCRRVLGDQHDAEDAFQATFLLLARKAAGLRQPERLGPWLHGVAVRTALKARGRRRHLLPLRDDLAAVADEDLLWQDLRPVLDEAIASLPWRYRDPVILCYLEGASTSEAALQLGCPSGTIRSRLTRARALLRTRLVKRGVGVPARMLGGILPAALRDAVVPPLLLNSTCSIGVRVGAVSATVAALAKGVAMRMMLGKIQGTLMALVGVVGLGVGALAYRGTAQEKAEKQVESPAQVVPPTVASEGTAEKFEVRTTNFQVVASSKRVARLIGEAAERQRKDIAIKWLNEELPTWDKPCSITVEQM
jgi:RNA polymerase sigma factor (sigma-70 family)